MNGVVAIHRLPETRRPGRAAESTSDRRPTRRPSRARRCAAATCGRLAARARSSAHRPPSPASRRRSRCSAERRFDLTLSSIGAVFTGIGLVLVARAGRRWCGPVDARLGAGRHRCAPASTLNVVGLLLLAVAVHWAVLVPALAAARRRPGADRRRRCRRGRPAPARGAIGRAWRGWPARPCRRRPPARRSRGPVVGRSRALVVLHRAPASGRRRAVRRALRSRWRRWPWCVACLHGPVVGDPQSGTCSESLRSSRPGNLRA